MEIAEKAKKRMCGSVEAGERSKNVKERDSAMHANKKSRIANHPIYLKEDY
jgi:hypothetical protein